MNKVVDFLFYLGIVLIPFTQISGIELLREYTNESAIYCWILGGILVLADDFFIKRRINFPFNSTVVLLWSMFFSWCIFSYLLNFTEIQSNYFKYRTGNNRFIFQVFSLFLPSYFLVYYFYSIINRTGLIKVFYKIRKVLLTTFLFVFIYALLELFAGKYSINWARSLIEYLNYIPVLNKTEFYETRLSSVSFEVPALGNYLIFIYGWMFSYVFTASKWYRRFLPSILVIALTFMSGARAALVIVLVQTIVGWLLYVKAREIKINYQVLFCSIAIFLIVGFVNRDKVNNIIQQKMNFFDVEHSVSNKTRYGMQYASLMVFMEHPLIGVGFGQNGFHKQEYYPEWAVKDNYEFTDWYLNEEVYSFPPDFNLYTRLLAETGTIGIVLFVLFLGYLIKSNYSLLIHNEFQIRIIIIVLFTSFIGFIINWLQVDFFRQFGFWLCVVLLVKINSFRLDEK